MKNSIILFILFWALLFSCKDPYVDEVYITPEDMPAASYMKANPDKYSLWVELLEYTDMFNTINVNANYTCFVPSNEAMTAYLNSKNLTSVTGLAVDLAKTLVKYHTIAGSKITQSEFPNGDIPDTTATGDKLTINVSEGGINAIYVNNEAKITDLDIEVTNAIIHVIDKVLTPIVESVWDKVNTSGYSIFSAAVQATGYSEVLANKSKKYTVFEVPDSIFNKDKILNLDSLINYLGAANDFLSGSNALNKFVGYHIVAQQLSSTELNDFSDDTRSQNINTMSNNELFNLKDVGGELFINYNSVTKKGIELVKLNTKCKNGVIHSVNDIMPVITPELATIQWELTDYSDIANLFPSVYKLTTLKSASTNTIAYGDVDCYTWQSVPEDNKSSVVKYFVSDNTSNSIVRKLAKNCDYLLLDKLGIYGWIQMQSPAILKGSYTMKLAYYSVNATSKSGKILFILDGNTIGSEISTIGYSSTTATYVTSTVISTVTFDITTTHTLRILAGDKASVYLDYIAFEPIN